MVCGTISCCRVTRRVYVPAMGNKEKATFPNGQYSVSSRIGLGMRNGDAVACVGVDGDDTIALAKLVRDKLAVVMTAVVVIIIMEYMVCVIIDRRDDPSYPERREGVVPITRLCRV